MTRLLDRVGVCSWSLRPENPARLVERVRACGVGLVQLALNPLHEDPAAWGDAGDRLRDAGIAIASGMFGCAGEDYSTLESIRQTGGLVLDADWPENQRVVRESLRVARPLGLTKISTHVGFIPHDRSHPTFAKMVERVRWVADAFAEEGVTLLLETGQETAHDLNAFLDVVAAPNVGVNFDPANMILYDKGDPIEALRELMPRVRQVHVKDAVRTAAPGTWGAEKPAGDGEVDWRLFLRTLEEGGYRGHLLIEREGGDARVEDVVRARRLLEQLTGTGAAVSP